jgi:hypothetical protein
MNIINLEIRPTNVKLHVDVEKLLDAHKGKMLHFELRYSGGNVVDLVVRQYRTYEHFTNHPIEK